MDLRERRRGRVQHARNSRATTYDAPVHPSAVVSPSYVGGPLSLAPFRALGLSADRIGHPQAAAALAGPYRDVPGRLRQWREGGRIWADAAPAVYLHEYSSDGSTVRGLVGALDVARRANRPEDRVVFPHEGIHPAQAEELAHRMAEMELNPAPILLVHRASAGVQEVVTDLAAHEPIREFTDRSGQHHRIWALRDAEARRRLDAALAGSRALIADGHHRYAAYLSLQHHAPGTAVDQGLAMLVDHGDTPLVLGAIHRLLRGTSADDLRDAAERIGAQVRRVATAATTVPTGPRRVVVVDDRESLELDLPDDAPGLAVEVVHALLLPALDRTPRAVDYHHDADSALDGARSGDGAAVLLPAPDVDAVLRAAAEDRLLPEKATSFQPKPSVGVLMRALRDG